MKLKKQKNGSYKVIQPPFIRARFGWAFTACTLYVFCLVVWSSYPKPLDIEEGYTAQQSSQMKSLILENMTDAEIVALVPALSVADLGE